MTAGRGSRACRRLLAAAIIVLLVPAAAAAQEIATGDLDRLRGKALALVNESRAEAGLSPLEPADALRDAAEGHARDMLLKGYTGHVSPEGDTVRDRYLSAGGDRYRLTAENVARCRGCEPPPGIDRVEAFHKGWMDSPGHRRNILREGIDSFGFGIAGRGETITAVQTFAGPGAPRGEETARADEAAVAEALLARVNEARAEAGHEPLRESAALVAAAGRLLDGLGETLSFGTGPFEALAAEDRRTFRRLSAVVARCGGCGTAPAEGDAAFFAESWLGGDGEAGALLAPGMDRFGFAITATGSGRKTGVALAGSRRGGASAGN